jgi:hypothetical protein
MGWDLDEADRGGCALYLILLVVGAFVLAVGWAVAR